MDAAIVSAMIAVIACKSCGDEAVVRTGTKQYKAHRCGDCFKEREFGRVPPARGITSNRFSPR